MKRYLFVLVIVAGLCSCEQEQLVENESTGGRYSEDIISILPHTEDGDTLSSRGTPITGEQQMTDIGIFCSYTGSSDWTTTATPAKMFNTRLIRNSSSGRWEYSGAPVSWIPVTGNDRYSFFAYAPYATAQNGIVVQGSSSTTGVPSISYTTPSDVTLQPDLMLAMPRYNLRPSTSMVALQMKHALTCVGFQIQGNGEQIKSLSISGISASGTASLNGDSVVWSNLAPPQTTINYSALINFDTGKNYFTAQPTMSTNLIAGNGYLMMIPQALTSNTKLKLTFVDNTTREISLNGQAWAAGKKINYNIIVTPTGIITLTPSSYYIPAMGVTSLTDNLQLSCEPTNMQWTLSSNVAWLRLSTSSDGSNASASVSGQGAATIYTIADANTISATRTASLYANGNLINAVGTITQLQNINLAIITNGGKHPLLTTTYVGAFWRAGQTGERIVRIQLGTTMTNLGAWTASVEWLDSKWKPGDICISPALSTDPGISYTQDLTPGDAELFKVSEKLTIVSGTAVANSVMYFRIGLNSTYTPTAAHPARYAVVILTFNNQRQSQLILLRQGEEADYVMRPEDPAIGSYTNATRPLARKVAAFNITQSTIANWTGGTLITDHPTLPVRGGSFTEYPSQAGAYFQWASLNQPRRAFHPAYPLTAITNWSSSMSPQFWNQLVSGSKISDTHEVCPTGYKRINDGSEIAAISQTAATSELRQSLLYTLADGTTSNMPTNATSGYYADGFFDRRRIKNSPTGAAGAVVSYYSGTNNPLNAKIAYTGSLMYNPITWASVFLPIAGSRNPTDGSLMETGGRGYYWTSSSKDVPSYATGFLPEPEGFLYGIEFNRPTGASIRCVKVP